MSWKSVKARRLIIAGVILLAGAPWAMATLVDSNSIVKDGIEYYFQTDKFIYNLGENVEMLYRVTNLGENDITFHFRSIPEYSFMVEHYKYLIWNIPKVSFLVFSSFVLPPNGSKEYRMTWDMFNNQGILISPGTYDVTGSLHPVHLVPEEQDRYVPVSVQIDVVPEPASLLLFGAGLTGLLARSRTNLKK